jgi:hypothetical protein
MTKKNKTKNNIKKVEDNNIKKIENNDIKIDKNPSVSLLTITCLKRAEFLEILLDLIKEQTYNNIIEWVIVEGSYNEEDALNNSKKINLLKENCQLKFPINYIELKGNIKLGELRNIGCKSCIGDITVCMDDDDFYPKNRVEHAVEKLVNSDAKIAGCSDLLVYDYNLKKLYKSIKFGQNHSTNTCMAWKKEYLLTNSYDSNKTYGEEESFTKKYTEPMVQLDPEKTVILSSHNNNTYCKKSLCILATLKHNSSLNELSDSIYDYIDSNTYNRYKNIIIKEQDSEYDIVYFCGLFSVKWDAKDTKLGGSEQAVVNLTNNWAEKGKKVAVYGEVLEQKYNNVDYIHWTKFLFNNNYNIIILWREYGLMGIAPFSVKSKKIFLDLHDNIINLNSINNIQKYISMITIDKIFLKSNYHKEIFKKNIKINIDESKFIIIPNGIRISNFIENKENVIRNPYRFCYCSCYTRGLKEILEFIWPIIYKYDPRCEFHVYYGMELVRDINFKNYMKMLLSQPGVMDHDRQGIDIIIREKYMSNFHLYTTNSTAEIDCISIRESLITGCIPLITNGSVFKEREGIHFDLIDNNEKSYKMIAVKIIELLKKYNEMSEYREKIKLSETVISWEDVSNKWLEYMFTNNI